MTDNTCTVNTRHLLDGELASWHIVVATCATWPRILRPAPAALTASRRSDV